MLLTSDNAFGFGQQVTGGKVAKDERTPGGLLALAVNDIASLKTALANLNSASTIPTTIILAPVVYDFRNEAQQKFLIKAKNVTLQTHRGTNKAARLINFQLDLDLTSIDNILIENLAFHSDGNTRGTGDCITLTAEGQTDSSSSVTNRVRITHCTFDGYRDEAIEIRSRYSRLLATIDHCYFFDSKPGKGTFANRGAINIASVILMPGGMRTTANSFVTVAFNYFENYWRRSPRAASDGTHAHVFNNLLYRWGFQADGVTDMGTWNGMETELDFHQTAPTPGEAVTAVIQANRFIPWADKQKKAISVDTGTNVDIGQSTDLANRFDMANGTSGNTILATTVGPGDTQTIAVNAWYTNLGLQAPPVAPTKDIVWADLVRRAGAVGRSAGSIPTEVAADPDK